MDSDVTLVNSAVVNMEAEASFVPFVVPRTLVTLLVTDVDESVVGCVNFDLRISVVASSDVVSVMFFVVIASFVNSVISCVVARDVSLVRYVMPSVVGGSVVKDVVPCGVDVPEVTSVVSTTVVLSFALSDVPSSVVGVSEVASLVWPEEVVSVDSRELASAVVSFSDVVPEVAAPEVVLSLALYEVPTVDVRSVDATVITSVVTSDVVIDVDTEVVVDVTSEVTTVDATSGDVNVVVSDVVSGSGVIDSVEVFPET